MRWLTITTFLPLVGVPILLAGRGMRDDVARAVGLVAAVATFVVSLGILGRFDAADAGFQMVE
nr:NADH-quinone oxidoreductase subunit M [Actinomycetota bacterium]